MTKKHDIIWLDSTDSTNDELRRHICDIDNLSVTAALEQTAGKGQRGNKWHSARGKNLLFSIALKFDDLTGPHFQAYDQFSINEMAALSVVDFPCGPFHQGEKSNGPMTYMSMTGKSAACS